MNYTNQLMLHKINSIWLVVLFLLATACSKTKDVPTEKEIADCIGDECDNFDDKINLKIEGISFVNTEPPIAYVSYSATDKSEKLLSVFGKVKWAAKGKLLPYDHTSSGTNEAHSSKIPAKTASTSNAPTTIGPDLDWGSTIEYRVTVTDASRNFETGDILEADLVDALTTEPIPNKNAWSATDVKPLPEGNWTLIDENITGYVKEGDPKLRGNAINRIFDTSPPGDTKPAYEHRVPKNRDVNPVGKIGPLGIDSPGITFDPTKHDRVMLRYHHWIGDFSGVAGKYIFFGIGKGWIGNAGFSQENDYGEHGGGVNTMQPRTATGRHSDGGPKNSIRLLGSYSDQLKFYGDNTPTSTPDYIPPTGRWVVLDIIIDKNNGYELRVDGNEIVKTTNRNPIRANSDKSNPESAGDWNKCKKLWYRNRLMHGGTVEDLPAIRDYNQWFGGFFVFVEPNS